MAHSACDRIRTRGLLVRSQTLYPAELHAHKSVVSTDNRFIILIHTFLVNELNKESEISSLRSAIWPQLPPPPGRAAERRWDNRQLIRSRVLPFHDACTAHTAADAEGCKPLMRICLLHFVKQGNKNTIA